MEDQKQHPLTKEEVLEYMRTHPITQEEAAELLEQAVDRYCGRSSRKKEPSETGPER